MLEARPPAIEELEGFIHPDELSRELPAALARLEKLRRLTLHTTALLRDQRLTVAWVTAALRQLGHLQRLRLSLPAASLDEVVSALDREAPGLELQFVIPYEGEEEDPGRLYLNPRNGTDAVPRVRSSSTRWGGNSGPGCESWTTRDRPRSLDPSSAGWSGRAMRSLLLVVALVGSSPLAQTPYTNILNGNRFTTMSGAYASFVTTQLAQRDSIRASMRASLAKAPQAAPPAAPAFKFQLSATDFKPAGVRNVPEQLSAAGKTPEERAQLLEMLKAIVPAIEAQPGVRKNNLSSALTLVFASAIQVLAGREFGDAEAEGLQRLMNDAIAATPAFKTMNAQQRTALYDACMISGGLMAGLASNARESGDAEQLKLAKDMAKQTLALFDIK